MSEVMYLLQDWHWIVVLLRVSIRKYEVQSETKRFPSWFRDKAGAHAH